MNELREVLRLQEMILRRMDEMALDLTRVIAAVAQETSVTQSAIALLTELTAEVQAIGAASTDAATQAQLDTLATTIGDNALSLAQSVAANTPASADPQPDPAAAGPGA